MIYENGVCNTANYSLREDGDVRVRNDELATKTETWGGGTGKAWIKEPEKEEGRLMVKFVPFIPAGEYQILDTDYKNYSVVYTCETMPGVPYKTEYVWILTRDVDVDPNMMRHCLGVVADKVPKYDMSYLVRTPQGKNALASGNDCPYDSPMKGKEDSKDKKNMSWVSKNSGSSAKSGAWPGAKISASPKSSSSYHKVSHKRPTTTRASYKQMGNALRSHTSPYRGSYGSRSSRSYQERPSRIYSTRSYSRYQQPTSYRRSSSRYQSPRVSSYRSRAFQPEIDDFSSYVRFPTAYNRMYYDAWRQSSSPSRSQRLAYQPRVSY